MPPKNITPSETTLPIISRGPEPPGHLAEFLKFVCPPTFGGGPLDPQPATRFVARKLDAKIDIPLPPSAAAVTRTGRDRARAWIIEDPEAESNEERRTFPSPIIRTVEGDIVHADVSFSFNTHTIHWHGVEPTPMNDGVGHTSFEATSSFIYQFATNTAGTYFYHCHKNTVLHFEMGLYGDFVVDPPNPGTRPDIGPAPYPTGGPGFVRAFVPGFPGFLPEANLVPYDVEALWVPDEFDSVWHELGHDAFMQDCDQNDPNDPDNFTQDGILNDFIPDIFFITGIFPEVVAGNLNNLPIITAAITPDTVTPTGPPASVVAPTVRVGQTLLVRLQNAGYTTQEYALELDALAIATDGRPFGIPGTENQYSAPFSIPANTPFRLTTARRLDLLIRPTVAGTFLFTSKHLDWQKSKSPSQPNQALVWGITQTTITVIP
ncbi:MAG: multicopper oxidase domain-containing protein [Deltaproteobacteria bacterium]|nr:multicopper oxidase domain-containing protein [Deltaproteobacteria bacterium]